MVYHTSVSAHRPSLRTVQKIYRHSLPVSLGHWCNAIAVVILIMSGLQIFNAHPALYWGDRSDRAQSLLSISAMKNDVGQVNGVMFHRMNSQ